MEQPLKSFIASLKVKTTERGFELIEFKDLYNENCSLQRSSLATDDAIWFGCERGNHVGEHCLARMHLNREQVSALLPILKHFVETGEILDVTKTGDINGNL